LQLWEQPSWVSTLTTTPLWRTYIYLDLLMSATPALGILVYTKSSMWWDEGHGFFLVSHWHSWSNWFFASLTTWGICLFQSSTIETALGSLPFSPECYLYVSQSPLASSSCNYKTDEYWWDSWTWHVGIRLLCFWQFDGSSDWPAHSCILQLARIWE
jgi:hypothetical protein